VGAHSYRTQWLAMLDKSYRPVRVFPDPTCPPGRERKVVVYQSKDLLARRQAGQASAGQSASNR
jgi:hypothetical protein